MSNYVNKIKKDGVVYDIYDTRVSDQDVSWVSKMKESISFDEESGNIVFNSGFYTTYDFVVDSFLYLNTISDILSNSDDTSFFPSLINQAGKVVKVNSDETGFEYGEVSG